MLQKIDVAQKLARYREKDVPNSQSIYELLRKDSLDRERIESNMNIGSGSDENNFKFDLLDSHRIFHLRHIRAICIDYRLRFLDTKYFKGEIPPEAISKIQELEKQHSIEVKGFKIIAPSKLFKLANMDDPLLFAPMGNDYYYLIHKWGNDLHPLRKLMMWPFKNVVNLLTVLIMGSFLVSMMVPDGLFSKSMSSSQFWIMFFFVFKSVVAIVIFYAFALGKNFNPAIWNSKYFNH